MQLNIEITPELESRIREQAESAGMQPSSYVAATLESHLREGQSNGSNGDQPALGVDESNLLSAINVGLANEDWERYRQLIDRRQNEVISDEELAELSAISDRIERLNVERVKHMGELAQLRGVSLSALQEQLGIVPPGVI